ncbi:hypothetical protein Mesil_3554 (plasmid) [Allomeiothermus silvanus DSM 9946]|uniref:Uncharacterized protein n=1 Tax=Allomeiothermus silvanus (strain ATCC 700542 / DSM 9946 / NBRC 106475 / NCIMB 13440 / VI-R2) TaxID=526227 RepID=D7BJJ1_ALLS1|nr:hypothetical protein [Allomeiothermus silvanus]ADH65347.1 hypothetical protein Mesil_3554 [Allomeiothermus silvanus DSM 9946]
MEYKTLRGQYGYMVKKDNRTLTRANPDWGGAMGTIDHPWGVEWRYFPTLEEALADERFGSLAAWGEEVWKQAN